MTPPGFTILALLRLAQPPVPATPAGGEPTDARGPSEDGQATDESELEVVVVTDDEAERLRESAEAVDVVETTVARRQSADLGEVLARNKGVAVRRGGGLGSATRFSLAGRTGDQIRLFVDGVPLNFAGYPFGIANVPVDLIDRVEVYRGVVPVRFGADALGGAVNLASERPPYGTHGSVSYQGGSFSTHRSTASLSHVDSSSGVMLRANGFFDYARNNYFVDVEVPNEQGRLEPARVRRFHDGYRAVGGNLELGVVERSWARELSFRAFVTDSRREIQNNIVMTVPYGEPTLNRRNAGGSARFEHELPGGVDLEVISGYAFSSTRFLDIGECVYDWFGRCVRESEQPGELSVDAVDQTVYRHNAFARVNLDWSIHPQHTLRASLAPTYARQNGENNLEPNPDFRDPITVVSELFSMVTGVEYEVDLFDDRLENIVFAKYYLQLARGEERLPAGDFTDRNRDTHQFGIGDSVRVRIVDSFYAKASYEWARRMPRPDEVFGDGALISPNLDIEPESSHNANLGLTLDNRPTVAGAFRADVNGFVRSAEQLIVLLGDDRFFLYENVFGARSLGIEAALGWTSPGDYFAIDGNVTYLDLRNTSGEGPFGQFEGDRIPNRPYLFSNASARLMFREVMFRRDSVALSWNTRYVHEFFRTWESIGLVSFKQTVPAQLLHGIALTYAVDAGYVQVSLSGEIQNLTDQPAFDFFGVQRPGRSYFGKATLRF